MRREARRVERGSCVRRGSGEGFEQGKPAPRLPGRGRLVERASGAGEADDEGEGMDPGMGESDRKTVQCDLHGEEGPAYVCRHLSLYEPVGFVEGYDPDDPDSELFQAWCDACDEMLDREGAWNDRSEAFAGIRLVCRACYREMRALNRAGG